jgi:hypothetical protein
MNEPRPNGYCFHEFYFRCRSRYYPWVYYREREMVLVFVVFIFNVARDITLGCITRSAVWLLFLYALFSMSPAILPLSVIPGARHDYFFMDSIFNVPRDIILGCITERAKLNLFLLGIISSCLFQSMEGILLSPIYYYA